MAVGENRNASTNGGGAANLSYGIDDAIALMRKMPLDGGAGDNLVVNVVRTTLESTGVDVSAVIDDGAKKLERVRNRVETLESEVAELELQVERCHERIDQLKTDIAETMMVKERLVMAQQAGAGAKKRSVPSFASASPLLGDQDDLIPPTRVTSPLGLIEDE